MKAVDDYVRAVDGGRRQLWVLYRGARSGDLRQAAALDELARRRGDVGWASGYLQQRLARRRAAGGTSR